MNTKEIEAKILAMEKQLEVRGASSGVSNEFVNATEDQLTFLTTAVTELSAELVEHRATRDALTAKVDELTAMVADLAPKVLARNTSAALKKNMTDSDALRVMTGDLKDLPHKDAAEVAGITYAQVYSCRLEFTFKHVHKQLRDEKWVNPWAKKLAK